MPDVANRTRVVWLVYPEKRLVEIRPPGDFRFVCEDGLLSDDLLPGFGMPVRDVFAG